MQNFKEVRGICSQLLMKRNNSSGQVCCHVYDTDEFRTSKLCCACKTAMDGMPLPLLGNTYMCQPHRLHNLHSSGPSLSVLKANVRLCDTLTWPQQCR